MGFLTLHILYISHPAKHSTIIESVSGIEHEDHELQTGRFMTDPTIPGVERLVVCSMQPEHGMKPKFEFEAGEVSEDAVSQHWIPPHQCFLVKGWTRTVAAMTVMLAAYDCPAFFQATVSQLQNHIHR